MLRKLSALSFTLFALIGFCLPLLKAADPTPLEWSFRFAQDELNRVENRLTYGKDDRAKWSYTTGLLAHAIGEFGDRTGHPDLSSRARAMVGSFVQDDGTIAKYDLEDYNIDMVVSGRVLLDLYQETHQEKYRKAIKLLRKQLSGHPRTSEGGFWHKKRYPNQMWLDGLYMGSPFYARYGRDFNEAAAFDDVVRQITLVDKHTYDAEKGLHYHGWDESHEQSWADKTTGRSPNFWGRAEGWYAMALVDVLDFLPEDHPGRPAVLEILGRVADGIARYQDPSTGVWWQVLDQGGREGNYREATCSAMFVYSIAKAVNRGWLPAKYAPVALRGYEGIVQQFIRVDSDGKVNLTQCCSVAGLGGTSNGRPRDGSFAYYISEKIVDNDHKGVGPLILAGLEVDSLKAAQASAKEVQVADGWATANEILARIKSPEFPNRNFSIVEFGASPDGTVCTQAIADAIQACHDNGGGRVVIPPGEWFTGPIHLLSNVNLHVSEGATLKFITDYKAYLPLVLTRFEGMECMNYSPLIYAYEQENIAVTGKGTLDGQATWDTWWDWVDKSKGRPTKQTADRNHLFEIAEAGTPVEQRIFGDGHYLRVNFIQPYRCKNVLIEDVTIVQSPMWEVHPVLSTNVTVRGITVKSHGPNNDGCDPESCTDVLIENCTFDTGDDCIAIKSGRNNDGRRIGMPSQNIIVRGCTMKDGHGGVVIGSEISGGCRNVFVENCDMDSPNLDRALRFKSNARRGGVIENVFMRDVRIGRVAEAALTIDFLYEEGANGPFAPTVRNVEMRNITSESSPRVMYIRGFPAAVIDDIRIIDSTFRGVETSEVMNSADNITLRNVTIEPVKKKK